MKVLITGAAGLYGLHTVEELMSRKDISVIYGLDDFSRGFPREEGFMSQYRGSKLKYLNQKFQDITVKELNTMDPDIVIHLAGYNSGKESMNTPEEYFLNNEYGTFKLIQTLLRTRKRPFFVFASTTEVYAPRNVFAVTKLAAEQHIMATGRWDNYPAVSLRFTSTYGENQNIFGYTTVVTRFIDRALRNEPLIIYGSGEQTRDFMYVKDAARALSMAVTHRKSLEGLVIDIVTGRLTTINGLADIIRELTGSSSEIIKLPCRIGEFSAELLETGAAADVLNWSPNYDLRDGLKRTICWHKSLKSI